MKIHIDLVSFALGFGIATIFWLVFIRFTRLLPKMKEASTVNRQKKESQKNLGREHSIRLLTLRKAQSSHLAGSLFPLEKVLIEPAVIAPPDYLPGIGSEEFRTSLDTLLPYAPEAPGLLVDFPAQRISLETLFNTYPLICLSDDPGTGKTTALAALASKLAMDETKHLPIFINCYSLITSEEPVLSLITTDLAADIPGVSSPILEEIIRAAAKRDHLAIFIDGMDELEKSEFEKVTQRISEILTALPEARIITTTHPYYTGRLEEIGFINFVLAAWNSEERTKFILLWEKVLSEINAVSKNENKTQLVSRFEKIRLWLLQDNPPASPFDLTLKVWLSFFDVLVTSDHSSLVDQYLQFVSEGRISISGYLALISALDVDENAYITEEKLNEVLLSNSEYFIQDNTSEKTEEFNAPRTLSGKLLDRKINIKNIANILAANGLLVTLPDNKYKFIHLNIAGYLHSRMNEQALPALPMVIQSACDYSASAQEGYSRNNSGNRIAWFNQQDLLLHRNYLIGLNWLSQISPTDPLRPELFKRVAYLLQDRQLPVGLRARFLYPITCTQDKSIFSLLGILKNSHDPSVRQLSALGFGLFNDDKAAAFLAELTEDEDSEVQKMAILSLGKIWTVATQDVLVNAIFNAEEPIRAYACELLSLHGSDGHEMLKEIIATDNYLARKAAVAGLRRIKEPWGRELLEKVSVEDTQWVVRDAAVYALDHFSDASDLKPEKWLPVTENPWTLEKSEEFNIELPPSKAFPETLLFTVLEKGSDGDRRIALHYLLPNPSQKFIKLLATYIRDENSSMREYALNAFFSLCRRGLEIQ